MTQTQSENQNFSTGLNPKQTQPSTSKKQSRMLWIIILIFILFIAIVFLTERKEPIAWVEDYNTGIKLAKQQNKPALICFFKQGTRFSSDMWQGVYNRPDVKKYVETYFVPILIDVDKQPDIAKRYNITYYPTHYVEYPNSNQTDGPFQGSHRLFEFIKNARNFTTKNNSPQ